MLDERISKHKHECHKYKICLLYTSDSGYLTISASKGLEKDEKEKKDGKYIRRERYAVSYTHLRVDSELNYDKTALGVATAANAIKSL